MAGWPVYALQSYLNSLGDSLTLDGVFGGATEVAVGSFQRHEGLTADGVAGPVTQQALVILRIEKAEESILDLPIGLLRGKLLTESNLLIAAVNWGILGGVDCGAGQYRVYGPPYAMQFADSGASLMQAFGAGCVRKAALDFIARRDDFLTIGAWSKGNHERAGRCAAMGHNWPAGALTISQTGRCSSPDAEATWARILDRFGNPIPDPTDGGRPKHVRFADGAVVWSRWQWCQFYAMGGVHGPGKTTRYVTSWT